MCLLSTVESATILVLHKDFTWRQSCENLERSFKACLPSRNFLGGGPTINWRVLWKSRKFTLAWQKEDMPRIFLNEITELSLKELTNIKAGRMELRKQKLPALHTIKMRRWSRNCSWAKLRSGALTLLSMARGHWRTEKQLGLFGTSGGPFWQLCRRQSTRENFVKIFKGQSLWKISKCNIYWTATKSETLCYVHIIILII